MASQRVIIVATQSPTQVMSTLKPMAITSSPLLPNTLRTLVLLEACNTSYKLSFRVLLPLIVGAYHADPSGRSSAGKSYVVFGKQSTNIIELFFLVAESLKPVAITSSPLLPNTLRTLVLLEACNTFTLIEMLMLSFGCKKM
jgi:hypothetical protein